MIVILLNKCGTGCNPFHPPIVRTETKIVRDTQYLQSPIVYIPHYIPTTDTIIKHDSTTIPVAATNYDDLLRQFIPLQRDYYNTRVYNDSVELKDSSYPDKSLGKVYIKDRVSENRLSQRDIHYQLTLPTITNTVTTTNTLQSKPKGQVFLGFGVTGEKAKIINGANLGIIYKTKKDHIYQLQGGVIQQFGATAIAPYIGVSSFFKIKLRK